MSREQSTVNLIQSPSLLRRNLTGDNKSTRLHSRHSKYILSALNSKLTVSINRIIDNTSVTSHKTFSHAEELPTTSRLDPNESQHATRQKFNIYKNDDDKSASSLSFQTHKYRTYGMSGRSNQNLSPIPNKLINTQQSRSSIFSYKDPSMNDTIKERSKLNIRERNTRRTSKDYMNLHVSKSFL